MITCYLQGIMRDDTLVCGMVQEVSSLVPSRQFFGGLGDTLRAVEAGGTYRLLSARDFGA